MLARKLGQGIQVPFWGRGMKSSGIISRWLEKCLRPEKLRSPRATASDQLPAVRNRGGKYSGDLRGVLFAVAALAE